MSYKTFKPSRLELINEKRREPVQPPSLLEDIKKNTLANFEQLLAHLFSATDDLFYDLSKRASSNNEQNLYFEAMREIRVKREGIANQYLRGVSASFSDLLSNSFDVSPEVHEDEDAYSKLSIVEGDDLEVDLARSNMVSRARDMYYNELREFGLRLDHLLKQIEVNEDNNPIDPQQLADGFLAACQNKLQIGIKAKLILYKLYEKHVLKQLGHIYADANKILVDAGILPKIPTTNNRRTAAAEQTTQNTESSAAPTPEELQAQEFRIGYDALSLLMSNARNLAFGGAMANTTGAYAPGGAHQQNTPMGSLQQGTPMGGVYTHTLPNGISCYVFTGNPGPVMGTTELATLLTQNQSSYDDRLVSDPRTNIVARAVQEALLSNNPHAPSALGQNDENIINLVAMFFDQIFNDESLPAAILGLISRLQIPILKVALKDPSFFNRPEHPARLLINAITRVGLSFDETKPIERDPLYKKIAAIIKLINREYDTHDNIFAEQLAELEAIIERENRKSKMVEERTTQSETGKSKIKQARSAAQNLMYQKLKDAELPEQVKDFLTRHWLQVLVFCHLKHGPESTEWVSTEQAVTDLIWISTPHQDARSLQRRERLLPLLMDRIELGLGLAIDDQASRETTVNELEATLIEIAAIDTLPETDEETNEETDAELILQPQQEAVYKPLNEEQKVALGRGENDPKIWEEMSAVERQQAHYEELSSQYFESAKDMPVNSWFEYFNAENGKTIRCKLASKIDSETYIFVSRLGFKVLERTRKQFACDMQFSRATPVEVNAFFDRIMGRVVKNIDPEDIDSEDIGPES